MKTEGGFTIIELMIAVAIAALVLVFGVPSFQQFMDENRTATQSNNLVTALNLARGEAVTRGVPVDVIPVVAGDWTQGWAVGIDADNNGSFSGASDELFQAFDGVDYGALTWTGNVEFSSTGEAANPRTFTLTPDHCRGNQKRQITVAASGRVELELVACP